MSQEICPWTPGADFLKRKAKDAYSDKYISLTQTMYPGPGDIV